jgi:ABC-type transport system substrate-binding protein
MSKVSSYTNPKITEMLKVVYAESDLQKVKPVFTEMMRLLADESPFVWIGYFNATNLWRDRVKNFKPSRGLTINVHDVALT